MEMLEVHLEAMPLDAKGLGVATGMARRHGWNECRAGLSACRVCSSTQYACVILMKHVASTISCHLDNQMRFRVFSV